MLIERLRRAAGRSRTSWRRSAGSSGPTTAEAIAITVSSSEPRLSTHAGPEAAQARGEEPPEAGHRSADRRAAGRERQRPKRVNTTRAQARGHRGDADDDGRERQRTERRGRTAGAVGPAADEPHRLAAAAWSWRRRRPRRRRAPRRRGAPPRRGRRGVRRRGTDPGRTEPGDLGATAADLAGEPGDAGGSARPARPRSRPAGRASRRGPRVSRRGPPATEAYVVGVPPPSCVQPRRAPAPGCRRARPRPDLATGDGADGAAQDRRRSSRAP